MNNQLISELPGLVAWYPHTEGTGTTLNDYSGNGNTGTITGSVWRKNTKGFYDLDYNGSTDYTTMDSLASSMVGGGTIMTWVYVDTISAYKTIASLGSYSTSTDDLMLLQVDSSGTKWSFRAYKRTGGAVNNALDTDAISTGQWYFLVGTYNSSYQTKLYVNGILKGSDSTNSITLTTNYNKANIGVYYWDGTYYYYVDGKNTSSIFLSGELTAEQINNIYRKTYRA